jgi:hypothetical protein
VYTQPVNICQELEKTAKQAALKLVKTNHEGCKTRRVHEEEEEFYLKWGLWEASPTPMPVTTTDG